MAIHKDLEPVSGAAWSAREARHLLNRAGFGVPERLVSHLATLDPQQAAAEIVYYRDTPDHLAEPNFLPTIEDYAEYRMALRTADDEERRKSLNQRRAEERAAISQLQAWWLERMTNTTRPLQEKMTLFWHGHFATSAQKVRASLANYRLNALLRKHATGNFKELTTAVGQSSAMLLYLDNTQNIKGRPNENWARELMELFTMGVGNYSEDDVKESARAFTGWTTELGAFRFDESKHDFGQKTFLGRTGDFDGWDILNIIFEQPATAEFIARKLWTYFAYESSDEKIVEDLAQILRENNYDIQPVLFAMFASRAFYSDEAMRTQIKGPAQFVVQLAAHLQLDPPPYAAMARASAALGQRLFFPPNVKGWDGGRMWINANTLLQRYNLSRSLVVANLVETDEMTMLDMGQRGGNMNEAYKNQFQQAVEDMPAAQRQMVRRQVRDAKTGEERRALVQSALLAHGAGKDWDVRAIFAGLEFSSAGACVDALAARYLHTELTREQRKTLAAALTPTAALDAPLSADTLSVGQMMSVLHLIFSMSEYQLC